MRVGILVVWTLVLGAADQPSVAELDEQFAQISPMWTQINMDELLLPGAGDHGPLMVVVSQPDGEGPHPVVLFSHGFAASGFGYGGLFGYLNARGWLVIAPHHGDGELGLDGQRGPVSSLLRATQPAARQQRITDLTRVIDHLHQPSSELQLLEPDPRRMVVIGHSLGASAALALVGQVSDLGPAHHEQRIAGVVALSVPPPGFLGLHVDSWRGLHGSILFVTGTEDTTIGAADWRQRQLAFETAPADNKYSLIIDHLRHHELGDYTFFGARMQRVARHRAVAFAVVTEFIDQLVGRTSDSWINDGVHLHGVSWRQR